MAPSHLGLGGLESAAINDPTVCLAKITTSRDNDDEKDRKRWVKRYLAHGILESHSSGLKYRLIAIACQHAEKAKPFVAQTLMTNSPAEECFSGPRII